MCRKHRGEFIKNSGKYWVRGKRPGSKVIDSWGDQPPAQKNQRVFWSQAVQIGEKSERGDCNYAAWTASLSGTFYTTEKSLSEKNEILQRENNRILSHIWHGERS